MSLLAAPDVDRSWLGSIGLAGIYAAPGMIALVALPGRPWLLLAAFGSTAPLTITALSGVALILLVPSMVYLVAFVRVSPSAPRPRVTPLAGLLLMMPATSGALVLIHWHEDPVCYSDARGSHCTSDVVTNIEGLEGLAVVGVAGTTTWVLAAPRRREQAAET